MTTAVDIKNAAQRAEEHEDGRFNLYPPVKVTWIPTGEVLSATRVDISGKYPNTVHTEEKGYWYPAYEFEIATE